MGTTEFVVGNKAVRLPASSGAVENTEREYGNVILRWNDDNDQFEYSTDGTNWTEFGSGGSGLFSLTDAITANVADLAEADEIRYVDDTDDGAHGLDLDRLKQFFAKFLSGSTSLRRAMPDRHPFALARSLNATAALIGRHVAVTATGANRALTFPTSLGENGQFSKVGNAGSTAFNVRANNPAGTIVSRQVAAAGSVRVEKYSGKWYFV